MGIRECIDSAEDTIKRLNAVLPPGSGAGSVIERSLHDSPMVHIARVSFWRLLKELLKFIHQAEEPDKCDQCKNDDLD